MTEISLVAIVVDMIFAMGFGNAVGGYAGDMAIEETFKVFDQCKNNPEKFWESYCDQIKENFEKVL